MDRHLENVTHPVLLDIISLAVLAVINLVTAKVLTPVIRGFFCDDTSIRYPYKSSTVPSVVLNIVGTSVPIIIILLLEWLETQKHRKVSPKYRIFKYKIPPYIWNVYKMTTCFCCGALFSQTLTDIGKKVIGRLRPNFLDVCDPNLATLCATPDNYNYIEKYTCTGTKLNPNESRVSFPSGHSSYSFYCAVFVVIYLQKRLTTRSKISKPILQFFFIAVAWFVALSRVMNNKHHWSDVLAGILLGSGVAIINSIFIHKILDDEEQQLTNGSALTSVPTVTHRDAHAEL